MGLKSALSSVGGFVARVWGWLDASRRFVLNVVWLLVLVLVVTAVLKSGPEPLKDKTTLVLNLNGRVVEQHAGSARERALAELQGNSTASVQLRDVLKVLEHAAKDERIAQILLDLSSYRGGGQANQRELAAALERFKASGKKVVAYGENYDQRGYQLAAQANEVYLHPMGNIAPTGFGSYRNYYKDLFDRVGVSVNVLRVGKYKSYGEPFFANGPSAETMESDAYLYDDLWQRWLAGVEAARKLEKGALTRYIDTLDREGVAAKGDYASVALQAKLVDGIKTRDEVRALLMERGAKDDKGHSFRRVDFNQYLARLPDTPALGKVVGVVVAEGGISDGTAAPGAIGGDSTAALIRQAREDEKVAAVVLRVNSPGGSALASEIVRKELELTRKAGKPVVVSMGDVAASGGYWISMSADEVIADASTITGSIGVFGMLPTADKLLGKLPLHVGGYGSTWLTGAGDPRRPLDPRFAAAVQAAIEHIYREFTTRAAAARKTTPEAIHEVAQGRVWTGQQAVERKLIDRVGTYHDAITAAAQLAKLEGDPALRYIEKEPGRLAKLLDALGGDVAVALAAFAREAMAPGLALPAPVREAQAELQWLWQPATNGALGAQPTLRPMSAHVHCLCTAP